jgi:hypothetical protein
MEVATTEVATTEVATTEVATTGGYITTAEMLKRREEQAARERARIAQKPNELCRCGSGKKFKKCCGFAKVKMSAPSVLDLSKGIIMGKCPSRERHLLLKFPDIEELVSVAIDELCHERGHAAQSIAARNGQWTNDKAARRELE